MKKLIVLILFVTCSCSSTEKLINPTDWELKQIAAKKEAKKFKRYQLPKEWPLWCIGVFIFTSVIINDSKDDI